jgi:hypothetical protein
MELDQALSAFVGVVIGSAFPVISTILSNRAALRLERLRIHEGQRRAAYLSLFRFTRRLRNRIFPLAENKQTELHDAIEEHFASLDFTYYGNRTAEILDKLDDASVSTTHPDLVSEELVPDEFYEHTLPKLVMRLDQLCRAEMRNRTE